MDAIDGEVGVIGGTGYVDSHVTTLVRVSEPNDYIVQDAYANMTLTDAADGVLSYADSRQQQAQQPGSVVLNNALYYMHYAEDGAPAEEIDAFIHNQVAVSLLNLPFAWIRSEAGAETTGGLARLFADLATAHGDTDAHGFVGLDTVMAVLREGQSLQATVMQLQALGTAVGIKTGSGDWISVRMLDGGYRTLSLDGAVVLDGSVDQLILQAMGSESATNPGMDLSAFLSIHGYVDLSGLYFDDWQAQPDGRGNAPPVLLPGPTPPLRDGFAPVLDLFDIHDADGDRPAYVMMETLATNGARFIGPDGQAAGVGVVTLRHHEAKDWFVEIEPGETAEALRVRVSDSVTWSTPVTLELEAPLTVRTTPSLLDSTWQLQAISDADAGVHRIYHLGTDTLEITDAAGNALHDRIEVLRDSSGAVTETLHRFADGGYLKTEYDSSGHTTWDSFAWLYAESGELSAYAIDIADGSHLHVRIDHAGVEPWRELQTRRNAEGATEAHLFSLDDTAGDLLITYDTDNAAIWSEHHRSLDTTGRLQADHFIYDDGGTLHTRFDPLDAQVYSEHQQRRDASGRLEAELMKYDEGGWLRVWHDMSDTAPWREHQSRHAADGSLAATRVILDDGTILDEVF